MRSNPKEILYGLIEAINRFPGNHYLGTVYKTPEDKKGIFEIQIRKHNEDEIVRIVFRYYTKVRVDFVMMEMNFRGGIQFSRVLDQFLFRMMFSGLNDLKNGNEIIDEKSGARVFSIPPQNLLTGEYEIGNLKPR